MSTRCNIKVTSKQFGKKDTLYFYQHGDGYPEGIMPTLTKFVQMVADDKLRNNIEQACGWLIVLGREAAGDVFQSPGYNWKVGCIEPAVGIHGDISYLYEVDLTNLTVLCKSVRYGKCNGDYTRTGFNKEFNVQFSRGKEPVTTKLTKEKDPA
jgi:hypothetical protein